MKRSRRQVTIAKQGADAPLLVTADYRRSAFGPGYFAVLTVDDEQVVTTLHGADVHEALHQVLDTLEEVAERAGAHY